MADTQNNTEDARQWFLRIGGETVFGPVSTDGLIVWAEQGRILPGHEVSTDRKKWVQAVSVELLDMRWFVDDGQGELRGPLNRLAAEALLKSGKVPEGSQLVSADDVEADAGGGAPAEHSAAKPREQVPEEIFKKRIRELESMVSEQRARLAKLADANALEAVQHERDVLTSLVKEAEAQRDTILRNAEKDARASERKQELLRQQVKKLEQQLEDAHNRLLVSDQAEAERGEQISRQESERLVALARQAAVDEAARERVERETALRQEAEVLRMRLTEAEREVGAVRAACDQRLAEAAEASGQQARRVAELEQALAFHSRKDEEATQTLGTREAELELLRERVAGLERALEESKAEARAAEARAAEGEAAFAELLGDANARDQAYQEKVAELEKACTQSPDEIARFYADQSAMYELLRAEIDELAQSMESERTHIEQMKEWSTRRQQALVERRQVLLKHMGGSPAEMTRRAGREQPSDAQSARLRGELENLRVTYQREIKFAETRDREFHDKVRVLEAECGRLQAQAIEGEKNAQRLRELEESLRRREHELADERRVRDAEREQFLSNQQALLNRIETLERSARPLTPDEAQAAEARNVKLASWMRLKR